MSRCRISPAANTIIKPTGFDFDENGVSIPAKFTTPTLEVLFRHDNLFSYLIKGRISIFDKTNWYRQMYMAPRNWRMSVILVKNNWKTEAYVDMAGRMGSVNSAQFAQRFSNLLDKIFNLENPKSKVLTNQDDSIMMGSSEDLDAKFMKLMDSFNIKMNSSKSQFSSYEGTWCGFTINTSKQTVKLSEKRCKKMILLLDHLENREWSDRRAYAKLLGTLWSCNVILMARKCPINPLTFMTRKHTFLHADFYVESELKKEFYDTKIQKNILALYELRRGVFEASQEASFGDIREGLGLYASFGRQIKLKRLSEILCFVDASDKFMGVGIYMADTGKRWSFSHKFCSSTATFSINIKEMLAATLGLIYIIILAHERLTQSENVEASIYIDNTTACWISSTRKASLKSLELGILSKFMAVVQASFPSLRICWFRIKTHLNLWADEASRNPKELSRIKWESFSPFVAVTGVLNNLTTNGYYQEIMALLKPFAEDGKVNIAQSSTKTEPRFAGNILNF